MVKSYKLREEAKNDIKGIGRYTIRKWGKEQRDRYLIGLDSMFESLGETPLKGRLRNEIKAGYYSYDYLKHVIYYRIHSDHIEILGVLHESMLPKNHLI